MLDKVREFIIDDEFELVLKENNIFIKNYLKLGTLEEHTISFYTKNKIVIIRGRQLSIKKILEKDAFITGDISIVEVQDER